MYFRPHVHPVVGMVLSGICVSSGLLMLSGNPRQKYGTLLLAGVLAYLTFYPYLESISTLGTVSHISSDVKSFF